MSDYDCFIPDFFKVHVYSEPWKVEMVTEMMASSEPRTGLLAACVSQKARGFSHCLHVCHLSFHVTLGIEEFMQKGRYSVGNSLSSASIRETGILIP